MKEMKFISKVNTNEMFDHLVKDMGIARVMKLYKLSPSMLSKALALSAMDYVDKDDGELSISRSKYVANNCNNIIVVAFNNNN